MLGLAFRVTLPSLALEGIVEIHRPAAAVGVHWAWPGYHKWTCPMKPGPNGFAHLAEDYFSVVAIGRLS